MEDRNYKGFRIALISLLKDLERAKGKGGKKALHYAKKIDGPIRKKTAALMGTFDKLAAMVLKLEQEAREI